jgi:hypothetical protein
MRASMGQWRTMGISLRVVSLHPRRLPSLSPEP